MNKKNSEIIAPYIGRNLKNRLKDSRLNYVRQILIQILSYKNSERFHGQTAEDAILAKLLPQKNGFYVDIGCGDPIKFSNTYLFYKRGWGGVAIDPILEKAKIFKIFRPSDKVLNLLVGTKTKKIEFWEFEPYGLSTADKDVARDVLSINGVRLIRKTKKNMAPLSKLIPPIESGHPTLLCIDVEGLELQVLRSNNWNKFKPWIICLEQWPQTLPKRKRELNAFMEINGYEIVANTGLSLIYRNTVLHVN
jgi:hypothetical protein